MRSDIIVRLHKAVVSAIQANEVKQRLASVGMDSGVSATPTEFGDYMRADVARWTKVIREAKIQVD